MKGVNKIVEEILIIAIVILLIIALFFLLNNMNSKSNANDLSGVYVDNCVIKGHTMTINFKNILDKKLDNLVIQVWDSKLDKVLAENTITLEPNQLVTVKFISENISENNSRVHLEFLNYRIQSKDIDCSIIA